MTLIVNPYVRDKNQEIEDLEFDDDPPRYMAGFEACRHNLWGHESARSLGLVLLPSLAHQNVYAEGEDLDKLEAEVQKILSNLELLSNSTKYRADSIEFYCGNFLLAISRARAACGGVYIG